MAGEAGAADEMFIEQLRERFGLTGAARAALHLRQGIVTLDLGWSTGRTSRSPPHLAKIAGDPFAHRHGLLHRVAVRDTDGGAGGRAGWQVDRHPDNGPALVFYATPLF